MKLLTRSVVPAMVAVAVLVAFFPRSKPDLVVSVRDFAYAPGRLVVHAGDSVMVENRGKATHTLTCKQCGVDSRNVQPSQQKVIRFHKPGTFEFACIYHRTQGMLGEVVVLRPGEPTPSPEPEPTQPPAGELPPGLEPTPITVP